jgi:hypothetical protein
VDFSIEHYPDPPPISRQAEIRRWCFSGAICPKNTA